MVTNMRKQSNRKGMKTKGIESVLAPMGAIVEDYRAFSDLGLHTGYVINIYIYIYIYIYILSHFEATFVS